MDDPQTDQIEQRLRALGEHLREAEAALATMREGDPTAAHELHAAVDAMASEVAALKAAASPGQL